MNFLKAEFKDGIEKKCKESSGNVRVNFYELIHTTYGFETLQTWFCSQSGSEIDEYGLWKILKEICIKITETTTWEIFDTLSQDMTITFKEFCMLIILYAAAETGQLKLMLYMHGRKMYQLLAGGEKQEIAFERFKRIGRILGLNENFLNEKAKKLSISPFKGSLNFDNFELFYYEVFASYDQGHQEESYKEEEPKKVIDRVPEEPVMQQIPAAPHPPPSKKKSSCTGCKSKACTLL